MKLGFIGLGKMGSRMVLKLLKEGHEVVVWNRSEAPIEELRIKNQELWKKKNHNSKFVTHDSSDKILKAVETINELVKSLQPPRVVWLMLPAGEATQTVLDKVSQFVEKGDIVIDGGNAFYKDTQKRFEHFEKNGIRFLGIGVSGGIVAATQGYPLMVGGNASAYKEIIPVLDSLAKPHGGHDYFGTGGAGHFVKMVHNGIEYGYMQAIGEGFGLLQKHGLDVVKIAKLYRKGSLVSGFMLDRTYDALSKDPTMENIEGIIEESGEARWTVEEAKEQQLPMEVINTSLEFRRKSKTDPEIQTSFAAKLIAALRREFGGHEVKKKS